ncbi:MAG: MarR family transcriptional regulator [Prochloraceae cyanobacterium]
MKFKQLSATEIDKETVENKEKIAPVIADRLDESILELPTHTKHLEEIKSTFKEVFNKWQRCPDIAPRSLVLLSSPIAPLTHIIDEALTSCKYDGLLEVPYSQWQAEQHDFNSIKEKLITEVKKIKADSKQQVFVIPRLEWIFLRSIEGLEPIEFLPELIYENESIFWLIGCNTWTWEYLNCIYAVEAYLGKPLCLSPLNGEELQEWLQPLLKQIDIDWENQENGEQENHLDTQNVKNFLKVFSDLNNWQNKLKMLWQETSKNKEEMRPQDKFFHNLARVSFGNAVVAAQLWRRSLQFVDPEKAEKVKIERVRLPDLPKLTQSDRYLLYFIILHGGISVANLAVCLAESESSLKARLQYLARHEIIERKGNLIYIKPPYYPELKSNLSNHNFLVGEDI